jgi:haloacetate dehalogenase
VSPFGAARRLAVGDVEINVAVAGSGPPLLLMHGYPENHRMWRRAAADLVGRFTVVATDLRGYGDSSKPPGDPEHRAYAKRTMAADQVAVMRALGHERFLAAGHDRGARVLHRMCLDHPQAVAAAALVDIIPTHTLFSNVERGIATAYYHWFFLLQDPPLPERLIGGAAEFFLRTTCERWSATPGGLDPADVDDYVRCFDEATIHASCEDYRAAATVDFADDEADLERRIECPVLVLWGSRGRIGRLYDVPGTWRDKAVNLEGKALDCGHFVPEERPAETAAALAGFFAAHPC